MTEPEMLADDAETADAEPVTVAPDDVDNEADEDNDEA
jgi:hypothetical protein